jgi:hypothetical protein
MVHSAKRLFEVNPLSTAEKQVLGDIDYASSMTEIKNAANELNELIPDRNADRTEVQFAILQRAVHDLGKFLGVRGLSIELYLSPSEVQTLVTAATTPKVEAEAAPTPNATEGDKVENVAVAGWPFPTDSEAGDHDEGDVINVNTEAEQ